MILSHQQHFMSSLLHRKVLDCHSVLEDLEEEASWRGNTSLITMEVENFNEEVQHAALLDTQMLSSIQRHYLWPLCKLWERLLLWPFNRYLWKSQRICSSNKQRLVFNVFFIRTQILEISLITQIYKLKVIWGHRHNSKYWNRLWWLTQRKMTWVHDLCPCYLSHLWLTCLG